MAGVDAAAPLRSGTGPLEDVSLEPERQVSWENVRVDSAKLSGADPVKTGISMEWKELTFKIGSKTILDNVTGYLAHDGFTCVLGPSGSGKSTIMNVLAGRQQTRGSNYSFSGTISVCGQPIDPVKFRKQVAYVMQDDSLYATETPRECLQLSAALKLPAVPAQERNGFVETLLNTLHLTKCANTLIGSATVKGISGGERKRTSVGVELITNPDMLFLDEPLSGLDSYAAFTLVQAMKSLADSGVPVLCTVHQPSSEIFNMFGTVIMLHDGQVAYQGPVNQLGDYCGLIGYPLPANFNPADHIMFLVQSEPPEAVARIKDSWRESELCANVHAKVVSELEVGATSDALAIPPAPKRANCCKQFALLTRRAFRGTLRNRSALLSRYFTAIFIGAVFSWLFAGNGSADFRPGTRRNCRPQQFDREECSLDYESHFGIVVSLAIQALMQGSQPTLITFPQERPVFLREYAAGQYGAFAYIFSKTVVEMPVVVVAKIAMLAIMYTITDLSGNFILLVFFAWMLGMASSSIALLIGCSVGTAENAVRVSPLVQVPQMLFSGLFLPVQRIPASIRWVKWFVPLKYAINLLATTEFADVIDDWESCEKEKGAMVCAELMPGTAMQYSRLSSQDILGHNLRDILVLTALTLAFRFLCAIVLYRKGRYVF